MMCDRVCFLNDVSSIFIEDEGGINRYIGAALRKEEEEEEEE